MACKLFSFRHVLLFSVLSFSVVPRALGQEQTNSPPAETSADTSLSVFPGTVHSYTSKQLMRYPFRGLQNYLSLAPGVVLQDGSLHVRGNRRNDLGYSLNGTSITNRFTGLEGVQVIPEAMARIDLYSGGGLMSDGFSGAGILHTTMKTGGDEFRVAAKYLTDDFAKPGKEFLGTSSYGFRTGVLTAEGPVPGIDDLRFFVAGEHHYMRNRRPMWLTPFSFQLENDIFSANPGIALPYPVAFSSNYVPNSWTESNTVQGTLTYEWEPLTFHFTGSYQKRAQTQGGEWPAALTRFFNQKRTPTLENETSFFRLHATHKVFDNFSYELTAAHQRYSSETLDPDFGSDWQSYQDSSKNAQKGYTGFLTYWRGPLQYSVIDFFRLNHPNAPNNTFTKSSQQAWTFSGKATYSPLDNLTLHFGGEVEEWTIRFFDIRDIQQTMIYLYGEYGQHPRAFTSDFEKRVLVAQRGRINHYGFDVDGNSVDDGFDSPRKPVIASGFFQGTLRYEDLIIDLGLRVESYNIKQKTFEDFTWEVFDNRFEVLDETKLTDMPSSTVILPRLGLSYPVSASTVLFGSYGETAQLPPLNLIYAGNTYLSRTLSLTSRGQAFLPPYTTSLKPERTAHIEAGLRQRLPYGILLNATVFLKSIRDQLAYARSWTDDTGGFTTWKNRDEASVKGLEFALTLTRKSGFSAQLFYTLSSATGTGSDPRSRAGRVEQRIAEDFLFSPLDFNQTHKATLFLDYVVPQETHPVLDGLGLHCILHYSSGHNYTKLRDNLSGSWTPWNLGVLDFVDPRGASPAEPLNNSNTPPVFNVDARLSKHFRAGGLDITVFVNVLNLFNNQHVLNVYSLTGSPQDDGVLTSLRTQGFTSTPNYEAFYRAINLQNRWAYMGATGNDLYGTPRQIRVGLNVSY
ncbi:MAG: hypothetical protein KF749_08830 [Bacteroidetes bacterium]|nr:hypothetical protein [Bacteroidota bacterium]MCW5895889.1 hypothetical protein [Bacteroidota bacterium]